MKKLLILSLCALGSMFARDCGCNEPVHHVVQKAACPTVYEAEVPTCQELRLVQVPAQKEIYYSCPTPSEAHNTAVSTYANN